MPRVRNVPERVKEAPAHALRAVFAGIGQALLVSDRMRRKLKGAEGAHDNARPDAATIPVSRPTAVKPAAKGPAKPVAGAATVTSATRPDATRPADTQPAGIPAAKADASDTARPADTQPTAEVSATAPPIPHYDELSFASLRARLRGLDLAQMRQLLSYEKAHGSRSEVIGMYERRIAKLGEADG